MSVIDPVFFDKKFNVSRYMLRYVVGAATDDLRDQQLQKVRKFRAMADNQIDGVIDQSFVNFNTSLARFTTISNQLQGSKTKNLRELLLQKYEAKKVIDIIDDIECIEAAPGKIDALLTQRKFLEAVDEFASALDLVFSEQLVAFHATTGLRNDLMECKQTIEDRLVQELQRAIYLKGAFANIASRTNQYSLTAIENELNSDAYLDQEFDKLMLIISKADAEDQHRKGRSNSAAVAPLPTNNGLRTAVCAVKNWLEECAVIVRDIREQTLNHQQLLTKNITCADLVAIFHEYEGYQRAKQGSPIPYHHSKVQPTGSTSSGSGPNRLSTEEMIAARELEFECELYDPDFWMQGPNGLLMDNARIGMLGYANSACDLIAVYLQRVAGGTEGSNNTPAAPATSPALTMALQAASWQCSALADECLLFLRREVRLHCCYYLTQLVSLRFDLEEGQPTMAQDSVLTLNLDLSSIENALQPYLASDKMTLVFNGVDSLLSRLLIGNLAQMTDCTFTRGGVQQMLLNIGALRQGLTGTLYSYPRDGMSLSSSTSMPSSCSLASRLEDAKRYYQLLNLSEMQLEMFLLANRGAYAHEAFRALWHVNAPHRPLTKGSVNKLDSLLR
ncbi:DnaJ subfamily B member 4 [Phytophthora nicotianae]|uniref:Exocyst complex component Sec8 n=1 Tax=Phytophthora nicotianae TaxID=4792 RepID=A0A0W8DDJ0_PHYNI|nr:DnaJ subfamily B member 4 [Phytophthora nicotianae]